MPEIRSKQNEEGWYTTIYYTWEEINSNLPKDKIIEKVGFLGDNPVVDDYGICLRIQYYGRRYHTLNNYVIPWIMNVEKRFNSLHILTETQIRQAIHKHSGIAEEDIYVKEAHLKFIVDFNQRYRYHLQAGIKSISKELGINEKDICKEDNSDGTIKRLTIFI
jgi:hypothetical protein